MKASFFSLGNLFFWLALLSVPVRPSTEYPSGEWDHIIENEEFTEPLVLGEGDDNTLIINSVFHDIDGDAIVLGNVSNVHIKNCTIYEVNGNGIVLRSMQATDTVTIDDCEIHDTALNGIIAKQGPEEGVDHTRLIIKNNTFYSNGTTELDHALYILAQDSRIENNIIYKSTGNGISIRSSGIVTGNRIWDVNKSCIRYFSDNLKGPSNTLIVENNICHLTEVGSESPGISLLLWKDTPLNWIVDNYIIRFNTVVMFTGQRTGIAVESEKLDSKNISVYGNIVVNTHNLQATIHNEYIDYFSSNYLSTNLTGFIDAQKPPYDFHLTARSPAVEYANKELDFPTYDADGKLRAVGDLDAGAYQLTRNIFTLLSESSTDTSLLLLIILAVIYTGFISLKFIEKRKAI
ncbi:MAG: right-handed parallel beta-helix repeat-containing protein [Anaerolineales bacterium]|nr:right-handed parallel beta-helix repeat-containing protein [Anaerolineales bacterium]